jgi:hypothetical protein
MSDDAAGRDDPFGEEGRRYFERMFDLNRSGLINNFVDRTEGFLRNTRGDIRGTKG